MLSELRAYVEDAKLMVEEALFVVFGDVIYDIGIKRLFIVIVLVFMTAGAVILYRFLRPRLTARSRMLAKILNGVEENARMLREMQVEKGTQSLGNAPDSDD